MFEEFVKFVHDVYGRKDFIALHEPYFCGNEKKYLMETIDSTFVSSVGAFVDEFENRMAEYTGAKFAVATVNGTAALHLALLLAGVKAGDEVITQSLTFVATCNAIRYCGAEPVFADVDRKTLGLSSESLQVFLDSNCEMRDDGYCWNKVSGKIVRVCVPMHTFGFPVQLDELDQICKKYNILMVEDAAESLGSFYKQKHTGTVGLLATLSFNGNKIMTTGGGGMILTNDKTLATRAKHLSTTAKKSHPWAYDHDEVGYNYRMPNLNAALGLAQIELLPKFIAAKRRLAQDYYSWGGNHDLHFLQEPEDTQSNYWLNTLVLENEEQRNRFLSETNSNKVMTRPTWIPMHMLAMNKECMKTDLTMTEWLHNRLVNVPSGVCENFF